MSDRDDALIERVLQRVDHPGLEDPGLDLRGDERRLWREYSELAGLLPLALDPVPPGPGLRQAVLAGARREGGEAPVGTGLAETRAALSSHRKTTVLRVLAAAAVAVALGMAAVAGWLIGERGRLLRTVAGLELAIGQADGRAQQLRDAQAELSRLRDVFTSAGLTVCPLRPWGEHPAQPVARAVVYFDGERRQWFLTARDLEPCRKGSYYVLWFLVDGKPVAGGSFRAEKGVPVALAPRELPGATSSAFLTLEPDPEVATPTGPPILYGEEAEEML